MSKKAIGHSPKTIQSVFVLMLLSLFAILSTFLVTVGAQLYRNTVESSEKNNAIRIVTTVLRSTIWAEDGGAGNIEVETFERNGEKVQALSIIRQYGETKDDVWVKRVYAYDGHLQEGYTEYYKRIPRKYLKAGQAYLEVETDEEFEDEFEDEEFEDELEEDAAEEENAEEEDDYSDYDPAEDEDMFALANGKETIILNGKAVEYSFADGDGDVNNANGKPNDEVYVIRGMIPGSDSEPLCDLLGFTPSQNGQMLTVELETVDHQTSTVQMYMRTGGAE